MGEMSSCFVQRLLRSKASPVLPLFFPFLGSRFSYKLSNQRRVPLLVISLLGYQVMVSLGCPGFGGLSPRRVADTVTRLAFGKFCQVFLSLGLSGTLPMSIFQRVESPTEIGFHVAYSRLS